MNTKEVPEPDAYSVPEFCRAHRFSKSFFYKLPHDERPKTRKVAGKRIITKEDARQWRENLPVANAVGD